MGSFAVQIAKAMGADVTASTSADNVELLRSLGADRVVDYRREDATKSGPYDLVSTPADPVHRQAAKRREPGGVLVLVAAAKGDRRAGTDRAFRGRVWQRIRFFIAQVRKEDLLYLKELIEAGKVMRDRRTIPLAETGKALRYLETGHAHGKVVITI